MKLSRTGAAERYPLAAECARAAHARGESMSVALHAAGFASSVRSAQQLIVSLRKKGHTIPNGHRKAKPTSQPAAVAPLVPAHRPEPRPVPTSTLIGKRVHVLACTEDDCTAEFALERAVDLRTHTRSEHGRYPTREERTAVVRGN